MTVTTLGNNEVESVIRKLIARLGDAADFHFAKKYVDCIVEEYAGKLAAINEKATYMGIPIERIVIMYDYLKNHGGAIDGGFSEGFLAGARYAAAEIQEGMLKAYERAIISGLMGSENVSGFMGSKNGKD